MANEGCMTCVQAHAGAHGVMNNMRHHALGLILHRQVCPWQHAECIAVWMQSGAHRR